MNGEKKKIGKGEGSAGPWALGGVVAVGPARGRERLERLLALWRLASWGSEARSEGCPREGGADPDLYPPSSPPPSSREYEKKAGDPAAGGRMEGTEARAMEKMALVGPGGGGLIRISPQISAFEDCRRVQNIGRGLYRHPRIY